MVSGNGQHDCYDHAVVFLSIRAYQDANLLSHICTKALDMFYFFGRLKEGLTAFFKFTELLVFLDGCLSCRKASYRYAEGGA